MRAVLLHIGVEKTGSTAIQGALRLASADLESQGFHCLSSEMPRYQWGLPIYAAPSGNVRDLLTARGLHCDHDVEKYRIEFAHELRKKINKYQSGTFIFSEEHCHSRLLSNKSVQEVSDFLKNFFDKIEIFVYIRRQDRLGSSFYSTQLLSGQCVRSAPFNCNEPYFDYQSLLSRWSNVFGRESINVAVYDEIRQNGQSVVDHFAKWSRVPLPQWTSEHRANLSISSEARSVLVHLNSHHAGEEPIAREARSFVEGASSAICGDAHRPSRADARSFYDSFAASNKWVRENYFPNSSRLFDDCFEEYPEREAPIESSGALKVAIASLSAATREYVEVRKALTKADIELSYYRGLVHFDAGRLSEARASVDKGLSLSPEHSDLWNLRGRIMQAHGDLPGAIRALDRAVALDPGNKGHTVIRERILKASQRTGRLPAIAKIQSFGRNLLRRYENQHQLWHIVRYRA